MNDDLTRRIGSIPFLGFLEEAHLADLAEKFSTETAAMGEVIIEKGEYGDKFYIVETGKVRVFLRQPDGSEVTLKTLGPGEHFGEIALLEHTPRTASVRAASPNTTLLTLNRDDFEDILEFVPDARMYLTTGIKHRNLHNFLRLTTDLGRDAKAKELNALVDAMEVVPVAAEEYLVIEDAPALYVVNEGEVEVTDIIGEVIDTIAVGATFGEDALEGSTADLVLRVSKAGTLYKLPEDALRPLMDRSIRLKAYINEQAARWRKLAGDKVQDDDEEEAPFLTTQMVDVALQLEGASDPELREFLEGSSRDTQIIAQPRELTRTQPRTPKKKPIRRFPFVRQQEEADCGAACLAMILRHHGKRVSIGRLRDLANVTITGASMASLADAARDLGFVVEGADLTFEGLQDCPLPLIAHWEGVHFVVVYRIARHRVWIADPATGLRTLKREEFMQSFTGFALTLDPTDKVRKIEDSPPAWRALARTILGEKRLLVDVLLAAVGVQLLALSLPIIAQQVVDRVVVSHAQSLLAVLLIGLLAVKIAETLLSTGRQYFLTHVSLRVSRGLVGRFYRHLLSLPARFFAVRRPGDVAARVADNERLQEALMGRPAEVILDAMLVVGYLLLLYLYSPPLTAIALAFLVPFAVMTAWASRPMKHLNLRAFAASAQHQAALTEVLAGAETVASLNLGRYLRGRWESLLAAAKNRRYEASRTWVWFQVVSAGITALATGVLLWAGAHFVIDGALTIGQLLAVMILGFSLFEPVTNLVRVWEEFQQANTAMERLVEVLETPTEQSEAKGRVTAARLRGRIQFESVFFRYGSSDNPYVLKNLSLTVEPGETVAVVGPSGSGKTTLARLLLGLYPVTEGQIRIDGLPIQDIDLGILRSEIAMVLQETDLFRGTVRENIAAGGHGHDLERIMRAARLAAAHGFIADLPSGYNTELAEGGRNLSGGQRQRLCLARALYRTPQVLVMDEPTSALDAETEADIQRNLRTFLANRAALVIAHRISTVRHADRILVLDRGEVVERGTHEELMVRKGAYFQMCQQQVGD